jgi:hypothetical protein
MTEMGDLDLPPNEEIELLFKFLSVRDVPPLLQLDHHYPPQAFIRPRKL